MFVCFQLCKAGLKTLQDLGPEMRLALNEDLEEEEEEIMMEDEELEENSAYKVVNVPSTVSAKEADDTVTQQIIQQHERLYRVRMGLEQKKADEAPM